MAASRNRTLFFTHPDIQKGKLASAFSNMYTKEYMYITRRNVSNIPSFYKNLTHPTSLHSVCSILHYLSVCITADRAGGERLGESNFIRRWDVAVPSTSDIYSLMYTEQYQCVVNYFTIRTSYN